MGTTVTARRTGLVLVALVGLLASLLLAVGAAAPAEAATTGKVRGNIVTGSKQLPKGTVRWFTRDWSYLGARKVRGGAYQLNLGPGTYWLQFVDGAPSYDVRKFAPTNVKVRVRAGSTTVKNVRMKRGGAVTGTAFAGGRVAKGARVVAANRDEQSFETRANSAGQFAIGGLAPGKYSVFTFDRKGDWVDKSVFVGRIKAGTVRNTRISLKKRAGSLLVDLYAGGQPIKGRIAVTAVSKKTGQWWTATSRRGSVTFTGLYPGRYKLIVPDVGDYFGRTGNVTNGKVRSNRAAFGSFRLTRRGASVTGRLVFRSSTTTMPVGDARVQLFNGAGVPVGETTSTSSGAFRFGGRLATQGGLSVVVTPGARKTAPYCKFERAQVSAIAVTTGRATAVGDVVLPWAAGETDPACA